MLSWVSHFRLNHLRDAVLVQEREEDFYSLTLPVKNKSTIEESLAAFCEGEALVGSNAFKCPDCDKKVDTLKRVCIKRLPPTVCFNLKRFELSYESLETTKLNSEVCFFFLAACTSRSHRS